MARVEHVVGAPPLSSWIYKEVHRDSSVYSETIAEMVQCTTEHLQE